MYYIYSLSRDELKILGLNLFHGACSVWGALKHNGIIFAGSTFLHIVMGFGRGIGLCLELNLLGHDVAVWV